MARILEVDLDSLPPLLAMVLEQQQAIRAERGATYGDPRENHVGITMMWAPMLQPHWEAIRDMKPIPEWTASLMLTLLKINRSRRVFHADNFLDAAVYLMFAYSWQGNIGIIDLPKKG